MTDIKKLQELFDDWGVEYGFNGTDIICEQGGAKVDGYFGFFTEFYFDEQGKFIKLGAWE